MDICNSYHTVCESWPLVGVLVAPDAAGRRCWCSISSRDSGPPHEDNTKEHFIDLNYALDTSMTTLLYIYHCTTLDNVAFLLGGWALQLALHWSFASRRRYKYQIIIMSVFPVTDSTTSGPNLEGKRIIQIRNRNTVVHYPYVDVMMLLALQRWDVALSSKLFDCSCRSPS